MSLSVLLITIKFRTLINGAQRFNLNEFDDLRHLQVRVLISVVKYLNIWLRDWENLLCSGLRG